MFPLLVTDHSQQLSITAEGNDLILELTEYSLISNHLKDPLCKLRLTSTEIIKLAIALNAGTPETFSNLGLFKGQSLKVTGRPQANLSWRKITATRWMIPFYWNWRPCTISGKLVSAISEAADHIQSNPSSWQLSDSVLTADGAV
jgi:hypothetical protein